MTSNQLTQLNKDLTPSIIGDMYSNNDVRNKLVIFYYKCKYNYDRKQKNLSICNIDIDWERQTNLTTISNTINYNSNPFLPANLTPSFYKYILNNININSYFIKYLKEALDSDNVLKKQAICYFNNKSCCSNKSIDNYNQYYFLQSNKFIGNR